MRVVLDTNVLFSALWQPLGNPAKVVDAAIAGTLVPVYDWRIWSEYAEVLTRARFLDRVPRAAIVLMLSSIWRAGIELRNVPPLSDSLSAALADPDDAPFLEVALAASAMLVTGNVDDYPALEASIVTPAQAVALLRR